MTRKSNQHAQVWLAMQCQMISGVHKAILILGQANDDVVVPAAFWPNEQQNVDALLQAGRMALSQKKPILQNAASPAIDQTNPLLSTCAFPLNNQDSVIGILVLQIEKLNKEKLRAIQQILTWGSTWLLLSPSNSDATKIASRLATVLEITAKSIERQTLQESASSVVTHLSRTFRCSRVSVGYMTDSKEVHIKAVSHSAQIDRRSNIIRRIEAAMEEALDEASYLAYPPLINAKATASWPAHKSLCEKNNKQTACTILLNNNGYASGAITLERNNGEPFEQSTIEVLEAIAAIIGPIFELKQHDEHSLLAKVKQRTANRLSEVFGKKHLKSKIGAITLFLLIGALSLISNTYRVSANATLEGTEHRALVAALDGFVEEARVRAGEKVKQGDLLARLDSSSLETKHRQLESERENLEKKHNRAIGGFERAEASIIQAQIGKANAEINLIEEQIKHTRIIAPIDGLIVSGDLSHTLGAPVERGQVLFEIAPLDSYRMALQVSETDIAHVKPGQNGTLALSSSPDQRLEFIVDDIIGIAETDEGKNGFRVEARLVSSTSHLRPGMRGVGKIETSERSLLWIWGHTLFDKVSLWLWAHLP